MSPASGASVFLGGHESSPAHGQPRPGWSLLDPLQGFRGRSANDGVLVLQRFEERWDGGFGPRTDRRQGRGGAAADAGVRVLQGNSQGRDGSLGPRAQDAQY